MPRKPFFERVVGAARANLISSDLFKRRNYNGLSSMQATSAHQEGVVGHFSTLYNRRRVEKLTNRGACIE